MSALFINIPEFDKTASLRQFLGNDNTTWVKQIILTLLKKYPFLQNEYLSVSWEKTDFNKGYAVGKINLPGGKTTIPVIVKEWILFPLDVINKDGVFLPLNDWTVSEIFTQKSPFQAAKKEINPELTLFSGDGELQFSPTGGTAPVNISEGVSKVRDAVKVASFIDRLTNINQKDVENILTEIKNNNVEKLFYKNQTADILEKLGTIKIANTEDDVDALVRDLNLDISFIYEDEYGNKFLKQANSKVDYVWEVPVDEAEIETLKLKTSSEEAENFKFASYEVKPVIKSDPTIGDTGYFEINDTKTPEITIINITKPSSNINKYAIYDCEGQNLVINENHDYFLDDNSTIKTGSTIELNGTIPQVGDFGIWVVGDKATRPFEVISIYKSASPGEYEIVGTAGINKIAYYPIRVQNENLLEYDKPINTDFSGAYYVPGNAKFVKLAKDLSEDLNVTNRYLSEKLASNNQEYGLLKIAGFNLNGGKYIIHVVDTTETGGIIKKSEYEYDVPVSSDFITLEEIKVDESKTLIKHACGKDTCGLYYFNGPEFAKYAQEHPIRDLDKNSAIWTLLHCRGSETDIRKLAELNSGEEFLITSKLQAPKTVKELAKALEKTAEAFEEYMPLKKVLVKQAAVMVDKSTVDAILSLGLINRKNLLEYVSMIPNYEIILSQLAELLVMTRLGLSGISEYAVADTIEALSQVVQGLKEIQSVTKI